MFDRDIEETVVQKGIIDIMVLFRKLIANTNRVLRKRETSELSEYEKGYRQGQYDTNESLLHDIDDLIVDLRDLNKAKRMSNLVEIALFIASTILEAIVVTISIIIIFKIITALL